jgi:AcrR family transcriptional regulator
MELIGNKADVSKALMYRYFDSLVGLLTELLDREYTLLRHQQYEAAEEASTFEDLVRSVTKVYLRYIEDRGLVIERLQAYPNISQAQDPTYYRRDISTKYFAKILVNTFEISMEDAIAVTDISFGLPASAGDYLLRSDMDRQRVEDITVAMIIGSITGVKYDISIRSQKLKR